MGEKWKEGIVPGQQGAQADPSMRSILGGGGFWDIPKILLSFFFFKVIIIPFLKMQKGH